MGEVKGSIPVRAYHPVAPSPALSTSMIRRGRLRLINPERMRSGPCKSRASAISKFIGSPSIEGPFIAPDTFFPDFDAGIVGANPDHLGARLIDPATGNLMFSFHSFVVKTGHHTILIDSCLGNDKERPTRPQFHRLRTSFIADLAGAGVRPEDVDYVMCTHLHWDHVGWNTRLENGRWVPTFPKARYMMARREFSHWEGVHQNGEDSPHRHAFEDSVLPVVRTGQSVLVDDDYALDDGLWFEGAPGHTPGNVVIHARSRDQPVSFSAT